MIDYDKDWILDFGCSNNMTSNKEKLQSMTEYKGNRVVVTANDSRFPITHVGKTVISPHFNEDEVYLQDAYHVPGTKKNLLSVSQLTKYWKYVMFGLENVKIYDKLKVIGLLVLEGRHMDSAYVMSAESAYIDKTRKNEMADLWLARLRHMGYKRMKIMMKKQMDKGLPQLDVREYTICASCQYGKAHQLSFEGSKFQAKEPLELVHSNVFGSIKQPSM